ncbi:MAG TPA: gliding motility-associated C-terminal domain-containing protein [Saprospiraceae bacterium]|nr:gliding motility-associated C-terminal domain-containing protein [Saprospiraceae bacterium]HMQ84747.1 gliding motility-associated C-terminal domain-containing protein [Saprospiraceae bacterium]
MKHFFLILMLISSFQAFAQTTVGLVAYYSFNGNFSDVSGNTANTGTPIGEPSFDCGVDGDALLLDGGNDEVIVLGGPLNDEFDTEDISISFYFKPLSVNGREYLLSKRSPNCFGGNEFYVRYFPESRTIEVTFLETFNQFATAFHIIDNTDCWQHITIIRESTQVRLYVNGEQEDVKGTANRINVFNDGDFTIGNSDCRSSQESAFNGLIDELRVYNRALDAREVRELYDAPDKIEKQSPIVNVFLGNSIDMNITHTCATAFSWSPVNGVSDASSATPTITPAVKGEQPYTLSFIDPIGACVAEDVIILNVIDPDDLDCNAIFLPRAFTPNDDGLNDMYGISNPFAVEKLITFDIFDRWGNIVFSSTDPFSQWDGYYKGQKVNPGVMYYRLHIECNGEEEVLTGNINILR